MIAQNVIAVAPFGHALAIQNSDIAPTASKTRSALTVGGSQSGTCNRAVPLTGIMSGGSTTPVSPFSARAMPSMPWAALSARSRSEGVCGIETREGPHRGTACRAQLRRRFRRARCVGREPVARQFAVDSASLAFGRRIVVQRDLICSLAPRRNCFHEAGHRSLQHRRTIAEVGGLADRRIDHRIERNDAPQEVASKPLELGKVRARDPKTIGEPIHDRRRQRSKLRRELSPRVAEIGQGQHDARAQDAHANLDRAIDREERDVSVGRPDRSQNVACENRRGVAGQGPQHRRRNCARASRRKR